MARSLPRVSESRLRRPRRKSRFPGSLVVPRPAGWVLGLIPVLVLGLVLGLGALPVTHAGSPQEPQPPSPPAASSVAASSVAASSAAGTPDGAPSAGPCSAPEYRQMDFWLGSWDVTNRSAPTPGPHGRNEITREDGGCVIVERYTAGAYSGRSLTFWDAGRGLWHQTWIDNRGRPLYLEGRFEDGAMVLEGEAPDGTRNRITWRPVARDGGPHAVEQLWQVSKDDGATWRVAFDGLYERRQR